MLKKGKPTQDKKSQYLRKDSSFNIRNLVMRTPTSTSPDRSPDIYSEEKQTKSIKQDIAPKPSLADLLIEGVAERLEINVGGIEAGADPIDHLFRHIAICYEDIREPLSLCQLGGLVGVLKKDGRLRIGIGDAL